MSEPALVSAAPPPRARWRRALRWLFGIGFLALVGWWLVQRFETHRLYYPTPLRGQTPADWGLPYEDVAIETADGFSLQGWWLPQPSAGAPVLLFFHGNAGNREDRLHNVAGLWQSGIAVLIFDYRGYGGSAGAPSELGLMRDGEAAFDWLAVRVPGQPITLFGRSLGAAVAAHVGRVRPAQRLILESAFTSAPEMARHLFGIPGIGSLVRSRFDTLAAVETLPLPLLVIHGERDALVPVEMGRRLFEASPAAEKTFRPVPQGGHNDTYVLAGDGYFRWIREFLDAPQRNSQ